MTSRVNIVVSRRARYMCLGGALSKGRGREGGGRKGEAAAHISRLESLLCIIHVTPQDQSLGI